MATCEIVKQAHEKGTAIAVVRFEDGRKQTATARQGPNESEVETIQRAVKAAAMGAIISSEQHPKGGHRG